jgi:hypothetical protein
MKIITYKVLTFLWIVISIQSVLADTIDDAISRLTLDQQNWINQSCPRSYGPSLWKSCMNRELNAINSPPPQYLRDKPIKFRLGKSVLPRFVWTIFMEKLYGAGVERC